MCVFLYICTCFTDSCKKSISRKKSGSFPPFVLTRNAILQHLIIRFLLHFLSRGRLREVKKKNENFKLLALKVVAVAYERWSLTRGSNYSDQLTGNLWYCGKLVAYEGWSQPEVGLYSYFSAGFNRSVISIEHTARTYFAV